MHLVCGWQRRDLPRARFDHTKRDFAGTLVTSLCLKCCGGVRVGRAHIFIFSKLISPVSVFIQFSGIKNRTRERSNFWPDPCKNPSSPGDTFFPNHGIPAHRARDEGKGGKQSISRMPTQMNVISPLLCTVLFLGAWGCFLL